MMQDILGNAIKHYGNEHQIMKCIEEMAELTQALAKDVRNIDNIIEECADVEVMLAQIKMIFDINESVFFEKQRKIERLKHRLGRSRCQSE